LFPDCLAVCRVERHDVAVAGRRVKSAIVDGKAAAVTAAATVAAERVPAAALFALRSQRNAPNGRTASIGKGTHAAVGVEGEDVSVVDNGARGDASELARAGPRIGTPNDVSCSTE